VNDFRFSVRLPSGQVRKFAHVSTFQSYVQGWPDADFVKPCALPAFSFRAAMSAQALPLGIPSAHEVGAASAFRAQAERAESRAAAGLVPFKTTLDSTISFSKPVVAERRIKRLKKSVWASGHLHAFADKGMRPPVCWFVTLTYRPGTEWTSKHMSSAIQGFRNWCQSRGVACRYTWVAELQKRGAVHYHLLAWLPIGLRMPMWDRRTATARGVSRAPFWPHGMTNRQVAKAGVGYLMKYLSKLGELTIFPKGLRLYGIGGLTNQGRTVRTWFNLPEWVKREHGVGDVFKSGNAFIVRATGEILAPAYSCIKTGFGLVLKALRPLPDRFHCGAYSTVSF